MKRFFSLIIAAVCLSAAAQNPICPMGVYIADPSSRVAPDGRLYIYGSRDESVDYYCSDTYHVLSSADLRQWTLHPCSFHWDQIIYAPDVMLKDGVYNLYFETPDGNEYVAVSDRPEGPFSAAVHIDGPQQIDPGVFIDDDGQAYYFWGQFSGKGAKMNPDMKTLDWSTYRDGIVTEAEHGFHEGSYVIKRGEFYYYIYADISRNHRPTCIGYSMSKSPLGPYEYKGVIIDNAGCDPEVWNNHGSIVEFEGRWYVLYHRSTHASVTMRKACIEPITFNEDGTINEVVMTSQGAAGPLDAFLKLYAARACMLSGNVRVALDEGSTDREVLAAFGDRDSAEWRYLDFGRGAKRIFLNIKSPGGGRVSVYADDTLVGELELPACPDWTMLRTRIRKTRGVHALRLVYESEGQEGVAAPALDWLRFSRRRWGRR